MPGAGLRRAEKDLAKLGLSGAFPPMRAMIAGMASRPGLSAAADEIIIDFLDGEVGRDWPAGWGFPAGTHFPDRATGQSRRALPVPRSRPM